LASSRQYGNALLGVRHQEEEDIQRSSDTLWTIGSRFSSGKGENKVGGKGERQMERKTGKGKVKSQRGGREDRILDAVETTQVH